MMDNNLTKCISTENNLIQDIKIEDNVSFQNNVSNGDESKEQNKTNLNESNSINNSEIDLKEFNFYCKNLGLCLRCQLRYLGELYSSAVFVGSNSDLEDKINKILRINTQVDNEVKFKKFRSGTFCFCCIGLLENGCEDSEIDKIIDKVNDSGYEFDEFQISISLPITVLIRKSIVHAKLFNKFRDLEEHLKKCYSVKDVYKFVLVRKISSATNSTYNLNAKTDIVIETNYGNTKLECMELYSVSKNLFNLNSNQKFNAIFSQTAVTKALKQLGTKGLIGFKLEKPDRCINIEKISVQNHSLFLIGRYNKFSRELSQTPWVIDGKQIRESLEEIITNEIKKHIQCDKTKFSASGREDVDVRMLGRGRPFAIELMNPKSFKLDKNVFTEIRKSVQQSSKNEVDLRDFQMGDRDDISTKLKHGEMEKRKLYKALCISTRAIEQKDIDKLNQIKDLTIQQETPLRVLHRRTLATRPKIIHDLKIELLENETHKFYLTVTTEAGTYVKEFVNSDFGRTSPSLETILGDCETDILELDVLEILYDWPPKLDENSSHVDQI